MINKRIKSGMDWNEQVRRRNEEHPKIMADLNAGMSAEEVRKKHDISRARVYQIKAKYQRLQKAKKNGK